MIVFFCILSWKKYEEAETPGYIHQHFNPMMIDNVQKSIKAVSHHMATSESHSQLPKNHESPGHPVTRSVSSRGVSAFKIDKNSAAVARRSASKYRGTGSIPGEFSATARSRHCYGSSLATSQHLKNGKKSPKNIKSQSTVLTSSVLFWFQNTNFQTI